MNLKFNINCLLAQSTFEIGTSLGFSLLACNCTLFLWKFSTKTCNFSTNLSHLKQGLSRNWFLEISEHWKYTKTITLSTSSIVIYVTSWKMEWFLLQGVMFDNSIMCQEHPIYQLVTSDEEQNIEKQLKRVLESSLKWSLKSSRFSLHYCRNYVVFSKSGKENLKVRLTFPLPRSVENVVRFCDLTKFKIRSHIANENENKNFLICHDRFYT